MKFDILISCLYLAIIITVCNCISTAPSNDYPKKEEYATKNCEKLGMKSYPSNTANQNKCLRWCLDKISGLIYSDESASLVEKLSEKFGRQSYLSDVYDVGEKIVKMASLFTGWPLDSVINIMKIKSSEELIRVEPLLKGWPSDVATNIINQIKESDFTRMQTFVNKWPSRRVPDSIKRLQISDIRVMADFFNTFPSEDVRNIVNRIPVTLSNCNGLDTSVIKKMLKFFEGWPSNLVTGTVNRFTETDIMLMENLFKGCPPNKVREIVKQLQVPDIKKLTIFFEGWPAQLTQDTVNRFPESDIITMANLFNGWSSSEIMEMVKKLQPSDVKPIKQIFDKWPSGNVPDTVKSLKVSDIKVIGEYFNGWPSEIVQDVINRIPATLANSNRNGLEESDIKKMFRFFTGWPSDLVQDTVRRFPESDIMAMEKLFNGWPPEKVRDMVKQMEVVDIKTIENLFNKWPTGTVPDAVKSLQISDLKLMSELLNEWPSETVQDIVNRIPVPEIKAMAELFKEWPVADIRNTVKRIDASDIFVIAEFFQEWPSVMVRDTVKAFPVDNIRSRLDVMKRYAPTDWWKKLYSCSKLLKFVTETLTVDELVKQESYKEPLTYYLEYVDQDSNFGSGCSGETLLETFKYLARRKTQFANEDFFKAVGGICKSAWPLESVRDFLQDKEIQEADADTIVSLLNYGSDVTRKICEVKGAAKDWSLNTITSELAKCNGEEKCIRKTTTAISSAQNMGLEPSSFTDWLKNIVEEKDQCDRLTALDFISALNEAKVKFENADRNKVKSFLTGLLILDNTEKQKPGFNGDINGAASGEGGNLSLCPGISYFLEKASANHWSLSDMNDFLHNSKANHVNVEDYQAMFELTKQSTPDKITEIQKMFAYLYIWNIGDKSIWKVLKEKNLNLDLPSFVTVLNNPEVATFPAIINFFLNKDLSYCDPDTVLQIAYFGRRLAYALSESDYRELFNESCTSDRSKQATLTDIIKAATNGGTESVPHEELLRRLKEANGKVVQETDVGNST